MTDSGPANVQRFYVHYPVGHRAYVVIIDSQRRPFDFSDGNFKPAGELGTPRDACLYATGRPDERADHGYSYSVEFDLGLLLAGSNADTVPQDGSVVSIHWLIQVGDEPDVKVDLQRDSCRLRIVSGEFDPVDTSSRDMLDESIAFEKRARYDSEYREFALKEIDSQGTLRRRLAVAVRIGDVSKVLRVLADDLCAWAGNLKPHFLHHVSHRAKNPSFVRMINVPDDAPIQYLEHWAMRDWLGFREAFDLVEFHKGPEYARSFSERADRLYKARVEFAKLLVKYTVDTGGEDVEGMFALDEIRKDLKHQALWLAEHLDRIATQFDATKPSSHDQSPTTLVAQDSTPPTALEHGDAQKPQPFTGGELIVYADRVELCGVDICSGSRSWTRRRILDLLARTENDGKFVSYSLGKLTELVKPKGGQGTIVGAIRDLRVDIMAGLRSQTPFMCGRKDVILRDKYGYRFTETLSVHYADQPAITDIDDSEGVPNVPDDDVRDAFNVPDNAAARRDWILQQLGAGSELKAPMVAKQFKCSVKTAQRDLAGLKEEGLIEYVGSSRTGFYRMCERPETD